MRWAPLAVALAGAAVVAGSYLQGRRTVTRHVGDYADHWGRRADEHPDDVLHYVALGDSAAQGVGASVVDRGYVPTIAQRLSEVTGRPVTITNLSVSGAVSDDVIAHQLGQLAALPFIPDIVTLDIGANDVLFKRDAVSSYPENLVTILEALPPASFVGDVPWMVVPGWAGRSAVMARRATELIHEHGHHLVRLYRASRSQGIWRFHLNSARDWFHPNDRGYANWADAFWDSIQASGVLDDLRRPPAPDEDFPGASALG